LVVVLYLTFIDKLQLFNYMLLMMRLCTIKKH